MRHLILAFALFCLAYPLTAQNPNCLPVLIARNGLAATLLPLNHDADPETDVVGIRVKATDFVRFCTSPCGNDEFEYRIRKINVGWGTSIPADTAVLFTCNDLGVQELEIWAVDQQGNASYALTYINVQNNLGQCSQPPAQPILSSCSPDVMRPTLLVHNGLAINLLPSATGGTARVSPGDFVLSRADNCAGPIRLRIRKAGQGTGVPTATSLSFNCADLGTQPVDIWAGDSKGNWTFATTYVVVQDNGILESDCKKILPTCSPDQIPAAVELLDGLTANVGANGQVEMRAEYWLRRRTDNCGTPAIFRIRKAYTGTGAPTSNTVKFDCSNLGQQEVEIWSRDLADNWSFTRSYVIVQDNLGHCGPIQGELEDRTEAKSGTDAALRLWPNPTADQFTLESRGEPFSRLEVTDMVGQTTRILELGQPVQQCVVPVSDLPTGVYVVRIGSKTVRMVVAH